MQLMFYKGPATSLKHKIAHWGIKLFTASKYSHVELRIDNMCWSSDIRTGKVRVKEIPLNEKWDVVEVEGNSETANAWFLERAGQSYDWVGIFRFILPFLKHRENKWFCSEACAAALGYENAYRYTPQKLFKKVMDGKC
jgi:hypothetical protein